MFHFFVAIFCVAFEAICDLLGPTLMSNIINTGIEQGSLSSVYYWGTLIDDTHSDDNNDDN